MVVGCGFVETVNDNGLCVCVRERERERGREMNKK